MLHRRMIALLLVLMLLVCAGCSAKDNGVNTTSAAKTTAATTSTVKQTTPLITLPATTTPMQTTTTTTKLTEIVSEPDSVKTARALLTEVYESRVFDDSLDLAQNPGLLSQRDFTGPFLRVIAEDSGKPYLPDVDNAADMDPKLPEGTVFLSAKEDELPEELVELLITPEKDALLADGKGMFALLEYTGYGEAGDYSSFKLYYYKSRVSFYDSQTGEMRGWIDTTEAHGGPMILSPNEYGFDGNRQVLRYNNSFYNEPPLWETALNMLFYDENGYRIVGTRLLSVPRDVDPIIVPEGVTRIEKDVGRWHEAVELILPESLESIGEGAFGYSALEKVNIPKSVRFIDIHVLKNTPWMKEMEKEDYVIVGDGVLLYAQGEADEITLPPEVHYVMPNALDGLKCRKLTVPETVVLMCGKKLRFTALSDSNTLEVLVLRGGLQEVPEVPELSLMTVSFCDNVQTVVVDCDTVELPSDWFWISSNYIDQLTVYCREGSPAEAWAKKQGIRCLPLSEYNG